VHEGEVKDSKTGEPIEGVTVTLGESTTTTDANGLYAFSQVSETEEATVHFSKEGYHMGSTSIQIKPTSSNYAAYDLYKHDYEWDIESTEEISSPRIFVNSNACIDTNGNPYNGTMTAQLTILDNGEESLLTNFPGTFKGIDGNGATVQFETYGLITLLLSDTNGSRLSLAEGETVSLSFKANASSENPSILPLWYYDEEQGLWFEEGYAQLQEDGTYKGEVSHLGTWSVNKPVEAEPGIYQGRIIDENGEPMRYVRVQAIGENWVSSDLSTDEEGYFQIAVIPESNFQLAAYNYQDKYGATYDAVMPAIASGEIIEE
jgi:hypothetical protein